MPNECFTPSTWKHELSAFELRNSLIVYGLRRSEAYRPGDRVSFDKRLRRQDLASDRARNSRFKVQALAVRRYSL